jgi:thioredoxin-like negative regulator of GroEL
MSIGERNWEQEVMKADVPVVIMCTADWCAPCKQLYPLLEQYVATSSKVKIVTLNTDVEERLAGELKVKNLPTLFAIFQGKLLEQPMAGMPTPQALQDFLRRVETAGEALTEMGQKTQAVEQIMVQGEMLLNQGNVPEATKCFEQAIQVRKFSLLFLFSFFFLFRSVVRLRLPSVDWFWWR